MTAFSYILCRFLNRYGKNQPCVNINLSQYNITLIWNHTPPTSLVNIIYYAYNVLYGGVKASLGGSVDMVVIV